MVLFCEQQDLNLYLYNINGKLITTVELTERLTHMIATKDSEYLITGGGNEINCILIVMCYKITVYVVLLI